MQVVNIPFFFFIRYPKLREHISFIISCRIRYRVILKLSYVRSKSLFFFYIYPTKKPKEPKISRAVAYALLSALLFYQIVLPYSLLCNSKNFSLFVRNLSSLFTFISPRSLNPDNKIMHYFMHYCFKYFALFAVL